MLTQRDVHIEALPVDRGSRSIITEVDSVICNANSVSMGVVSNLMRRLIDHLVSEYVSPSGPDSVLSLYLGNAGGGQLDPLVTERLSDMVDVSVKLQELFSVHQKSVEKILLRKIFTFAKQRLQRNLADAFIRLSVASGPRKKTCPPLPFTPQTGKSKPPPTPPRILPPGVLVGKVSAPPTPPRLLPPGAFVGKVGAPPTPPRLLPPGALVGKVSAPPTPPRLPLPGVSVGPPVPGGQPLVSVEPSSGVPMGKVKAPPTPPRAVLGPVNKGKAPPTALPPSKGKAPSLGPPPPRLPSGPTPPPVVSHVEEQSIFEVPQMDVGGECRRVHWQSIPVSRFKNSIFDIELYQKMDKYKSIFFDSEKVKSHFVKPPVVVSPPTCSPARFPPTAASSPVATAIALTLPSVLGTKRSQQIEIFLNGRKGLSSSDIERIIRTGGDADCIDLLEAVVPLYPTEEERVALAGLGGGLCGKADAFLIDLLRIPNFKIAVNYIVILHTAETVAIETLEYLSRLIEFEMLVLESKNIPILLKIIGQIVVYLWNGKKSNFNGFSIEVVPQIKKIHSFIDKEYSMMNCVVDSITSVQLTDILGTLSQVESLLDFDYADTLVRSEELQRSVSSIKPGDRLDSAFYSELVPRLSAFKERMQTEYFPRLGGQLETVKLKSIHLLKYFAESEKKNLNEFLGSLNTLRVDLASAQAQNEKRLFRKLRTR